MAGKDLTNRQLLQALNPRFDKLEDMISGVADTLADVVDNMLTHKDLEQLRLEMNDLELRIMNTMATTNALADLELRLGRRIDDALAAGTIR
jgi:hypothetical protein